MDRVDSLRRIGRAQLLELARKSPELLMAVVRQLGQRIVIKTVTVYTNAFTALEMREFDRGTLDDLANPSHKVGDEPGFFAVLNAPSIQEAKAMVEAGEERLEVFDLDVVPVNQFPHFT